MNTVSGDEPCPCGSGKIYMQCCLLLDTAAAQNKPDQTVLVQQILKAATDHHQAGRVVEAEALYREILLHEPQHSAALNNLGNVLKAQHKLDEAVACYRQVLEFHPRYAAAHRNLASALQTQGQLGEAIKHCRLAITVKPDFVRAYETLANIHIDLGQFELARSVIAKIMEIEPNNARIWAMLPGLRKMTMADEDWAKTAIKLVSQGDNVPLNDAIALWFAIGKYGDDTRQYDAAFAAYRQANLLKRQLKSGFNRAGLTQLVDALIATYTSDFVGQQRQGASLSERPVLIVGMPRSGTSLAEQIIASHPDACGAGELIFWSNQSHAHLSTELAGNYDAQFLARAAAEYEQLLHRHSAAARRVIDKMPGNFWRLGLVSTVFPHARIVHMQRNPIDTCLSMYFQNFDASHAYATDLDDLAFYYREYRRIMAHWRTVLPPERFLDVPYEALTADQEAWSRRIIGFLGLEWDRRCLDFHETERKVGTASNWQVRQKIYQTSKERWRHYEKHAGPLLGLLLDEERVPV